MSSFFQVLVELVVRYIPLVNHLLTQHAPGSVRVIVEVGLPVKGCAVLHIKDVVLMRPPNTKRSQFLDRDVFATRLFVSTIMVMTDNETKLNQKVYMSSQIEDINSIINNNSGNNRSNIKSSNNNSNNSKVQK